MGLFSSSSKDAKHEARQAKDMDRLIKSQKMSAREMAKVERKHGKGK